MFGAKGFPAHGTAILVATVLASSPVLAEDMRHMGAHLHGVTRVQIAVEDGRVQVSLRAPGADLVGFEHPARDDVDRAAIEDALARLSAPDNVVAFGPAAKCALVASEVTLRQDEDGRPKVEEHAEAARHSLFEAIYAFDCAVPDRLTSARFPYFETFADVLEIEAEIVTASGARAAELTRDENRLSLE